jgi:hypothetical protein
MSKNQESPLVKPADFPVFNQKLWPAMPVASLQDEQTFPRYKRVPFNSDSLPQDAFLLAAF